MTWTYLREDLRSCTRQISQSQDLIVEGEASGTKQASLLFFLNPT